MPLGGGRGILNVKVWPNWAGALLGSGEEPISHERYERSKISWELVKGVLYGRAEVQVPAGEWMYVAYFHSPDKPDIITSQRFAHPILMHSPGVLTIQGITEQDTTISAGGVLSLNGKK